MFFILNLISVMLYLPIFCKTTTMNYELKTGWLLLLLFLTFPTVFAKKILITFLHEKVLHMKSNDLESV